MNILIVGGTGQIGGHAALHLSSKGHKVTISSRQPPAADFSLSNFPFIAGDYIEESYDLDTLTGFDAIIFAAGVDMRHVPQGEDADAYYLYANGEQLPKFAKLACDAGVETFIHISSFYPRVVPEMIEKNAYVRSRHLADEALCALNSRSFRTLNLNAPFVVGYPMGMKHELFVAYVNYARGYFANIPPFGPAGGSNFLSVQSLSEAIEGALERGVGGTSYLLGDQNLTFAKFFEYFFRAVGNKVMVPAIDKEHPLLPDVALLPGRGQVVRYEPDAEETALLAYRRNDIKRTINEIVADARAIQGSVATVTLSANAICDPELMRIACLYAHAVDTKDLDILKEIMTDDAIIISPVSKLEGLAEILSIPVIIAKLFYQTSHQIYQQLVEIDGDEACGITYCKAEHILLPEGNLPPHQSLTWVIRYQDRFVKQAGTWRFKYRGLVVDWMELRPISQGLA